MSIALPLIGALLAAIAAILWRRQPDAPTPARPVAQDLVGLVAIVVGLVVAFRYAPEIDHTYIAFGAIIGALAVVRPSKSIWPPQVSAAWGIAFASVLSMLPSVGIPTAQLAFIAVAGLAAIATGEYAAALAGTMVVAVDRFGILVGGSPSLSWVGSVFGCALLAAYVIAQVLPTKVEYRTWLIAGIAQLACLGVYYWTQDQMLAGAGALGVVTAVVLSILLPNDLAVKPSMAGLGAIIGVALATVAFALDRGFAMSFALLAAGGVLLMSGYTRAILALGPLFGLVLFRLLKNIYPETTRSFDIGQHYALIGLLIAAILPLIVVDWSALRRPKMTHGIAAGILVLIAMVLPPILTVFFGSIGIVGFVVGLGFAGLFELIRQGNSTLSLSTGAGLGGVLLLSYGWLSKSLDMTREEKIGILTWSAAGILLASVAVVFLTRKEDK